MPITVVFFCLRKTKIQCQTVEAAQINKVVWQSNIITLHRKKQSQIEV